MRVFVTGATGNIGSVVVKELIAAGHQVLGLCRSEDKAPALAAAGAEVYRGSIEDADLLTRGAAQSDGVIHLAFNHDFSRFVANCEDDRRVIKALGKGLAGSSRPLIVTSGTAIANTAPGEPAREDNPTVSSAVHPRAATEEAAAEIAETLGVNVSVVRLPQVHDPLTQGLITPAIAMYRAKGVCAYVGEGLNRWPLQAGGGARGAGREISRRRRGGRGDARDRGGHRAALDAACQVDRSRGSPGLFRLARDVRRPRHARLERADATETRLAADRAKLDRRSRTARRRLGLAAGIAGSDYHDSPGAPVFSP